MSDRAEREDTEMSRDYQEFVHGSQTIFVAIDPPGDQQNSVKYLIIVENGRAEILTSWEVKTVPDFIDMVERSIGGPSRD